MSIINKGFTEEQRKFYLERNKKIVSRWLDGLNYREVGEEFDLSSHRASQIICRHMRNLGEEFTSRKLSERPDAWRERVKGLLENNNE